MDPSAPAMKAPPGVVPNLDHPPKQNAMAIGLFTFMLAITTVCVVLRAYAKKKTRTGHLEDVFTLVAYGGYLGCSCASYGLALHPGYFIHTWNTRVRDVKLAYLYMYIFGHCYTVAIACVKVAILMEWCRIFVAGNRRASFFWLGSTAVIVLQTVFSILAILLLNLQCGPRRRHFDPWVAGACVPLNTVQRLSAGVQILSDLAIFLLPQKSIWALNMSVQKKLAVAVVFGLGALAVASSILRLMATVTLGRSEDTLYNIGTLNLLGTLEMCCGFLIACVPTLPLCMADKPVSRGIRSALRVFHGRAKRSRSNANVDGFDTNTNANANKHNTRQSKSLPAVLGGGGSNSHNADGQLYTPTDDDDGLHLVDMRGHSDSAEHQGHQSAGPYSRPVARVDICPEQVRRSPLPSPSCRYASSP